MSPPSAPRVFDGNIITHSLKTFSFVHAHHQIYSVFSTDYEFQNPYLFCFCRMRTSTLISISRLLMKVSTPRTRVAVKHKHTSGHRSTSLHPALCEYTALCPRPQTIFDQDYKMSRVRSVKHNYLLVTYNNMFRPTRRPSSG